MRKNSKRWLVTLSLSLAVAGGLAAAGTAEAANNAMKDLMKKMGAVAAGEDAKPLAPMLAQAKSMKPADPDYAAWDGIADKGKAAAEAGDLAGAKASCKECHNQYRDKYKTKHGSKAP